MPHIHQHFYCVGISHASANAQRRGRFALSVDARIRLLLAAKRQGFVHLFVLVTCNRTEIYGFSESAGKLKILLSQFTQGTVSELSNGGYVHKNQAAIHHVFRVGAGLESQILGDSQISAQLKYSFAMAKIHGPGGVFLDRLAAAVAQTAKQVKSKTGLSSGLTSAASAAAAYICAHTDFATSKNILLFGAGTIGKNTCENLLKKVPNATLTLINRSHDKAEKIGRKYDIAVKLISLLEQEIKKSDILIVATGADAPTITKDMITDNKNLLILDLSMPRNVVPDIADTTGVTLVHLDELVQITNQGLHDRRVHIPRAEAIVHVAEQGFYTWCAERKYAPALKTLKMKLLSKPEYNDIQVRKFTAQFAVYLKDNTVSATQSMKLTSDVFRLKHILDNHAA